MVKDLPANAGDTGDVDWQPTLVFLPGKFHSVGRGNGQSKGLQSQTQLNDCVHTQYGRQ